MLNKAHLYRLVKFWLTTLVILINVGYPRQRIFQINPNLLQEYYQLLESTSEKPFNEKAQSLKTFLHKNPGFHRVYHKIYLLYYSQNKIERAKSFFESLSFNSQQYPYSNWILAKIALHQNQPDSAFYAFKRALAVENPPVALIGEFIEFDRRNSWQYGSSKLLSKLNLSPEFDEIIPIIFSYHQQKYNQTIQQLEMLPDEKSHHPTLIYIWGICYRQLHKPAQEDSIWNLKLRIAQGTNDLQSAAKAFSLIGLFHSDKNDFDQALGYYQSSLKIAKRIKDWKRTLIVLSNTGNVHMRLGDYDNALPNFRTALKIAKKIRYERYLAFIYSGIAQSLYFTENYSEAISMFDEADRCARRNHYFGQLTTIKIDRGNLYFSLKQYKLAEREFQEAFEIAKRINYEVEKNRARVKLADLLFNRKKYSEAREKYQKFVNEIPTHGYLRYHSYWWSKIGDTYQFEGKLNLARECYFRAIEFAKKASSNRYIAYGELKVAEIDLKTGQIKPAIQRLDSALFHALQTEETSLKTNIYITAGNALKEAGNLDQAISNYFNAIKIIEKKREDIKAAQMRIGYFSNNSIAYQKLSECYFQRYENSQDIKALDSLIYCMEMARSRTLKDLVFRSELSSRKLKSDQHYQEYLKLCNRLRRQQRERRILSLNGISKEVEDSLRAQLEVTRYSLIGQMLRLYELDTLSVQHNDSLNLGLTAIPKKTLKQNSGLIIYHISDTIAFAVVATKEQTSAMRLSVSKENLQSSIDSLIIPFHNLTKKSIDSTKFRASIAFRLYQKLIKPIEEEFNLPENLIILPDLTMANLPLELLLSAQPEKTEFVPGQFPAYAKNYLLHKYAFAYIPNLELLRDKHRSQTNSSDLLVFANPSVYPSSSVAKLRETSGWNPPPLPYAELEAERIKKAYPQTKVYKLKDATESLFLKKASQFSILHVATHGFVDTTFDAFSGLFFAMSNDSLVDGMLMGYEISELDLNCDLITLSACETGRGKVVAGEGVLGLPRLFLGAGVDAVLMTRWKVEDKFTSDLMPEIYRQLLDKGLSKDRALNKAIRVIMKQKLNNEKYSYLHPLFWAGFSLFGNPGKISSQSASISSSPLFITIVILLIVGAGVLFYRKRILAVFKNN